MSLFADRVIEFMRKVPKGRVVSYGLVAAAIGNPKAARQVGGVLRALPADSGVPWWRVVNRDGFLSIKGNWEASKELQKQLLEKEGIKFDENFILDMKRYLYRGANK